MSRKSKPTRKEEQSKAAQAGAASSPAAATRRFNPARAPQIDKSKTRPLGLSDRAAVLCVCLFLVALTWVVFGQTVNFGFVNFDDDLYVYANPQIAGGLSARGVAWAFTHLACNFYHPLTMISLMADYDLYGTNAGGYHLTNVLIHTASAVLLFLILRHMTGALWRSAFVAAVFAIHPLRAESVAWVSERKDVLGTFFFMLTLGAYIQYARQPDSRRRYLLMLGVFVVDLLCKPTAVALPFALLLLDYWPLGRMNYEGGEAGTGGVSIWDLVKEKIPLLALAAAACVVAYLAQGEAVVPVARMPIPMRVGNALVSYVVYLRQMVWPAGLAVFYDYPAKGHPVWELALALLLLAGISAVVVVLGRRRAWLPVGWFWYLGMLVPVIGIVAVNPSAHGDRYTYLPQIGVSIMVAWSVADWTIGWKHRTLLRACLMVAVLGALSVCARIQTSFWRNNQTLWPRVLAFYPKSRLANYNLALALGDKGLTAQAIIQYQKTLECDPNYPQARNNLGNLLRREGKVVAAIAQFRAALAASPDFADAHNNLANALDMNGSTEEALAEYRKALDLQPGNWNTRQNLGQALLRKGDLDGAMTLFEKNTVLSLDPAERWFTLGKNFSQSGALIEAMACYRKTVSINPQFAEAWAGLGLACFKKGDASEAIESLQKALDLKPAQPQLQSRLAWLLATTADASLRNGAKAVALAEQAAQSAGAGDPMILGTLAAAYAEAGRFDEATTTARQAMNLAAAQKNDPLSAALQEELKLYQAGQPMRGAK